VPGSILFKIIQYYVSCVCILHMIFFRHRCDKCRNKFLYYSYLKQTVNTDDKTIRLSFYFISEITQHISKKYSINTYIKTFRIHLTAVCNDEIQLFSKLIWKFNVHGFVHRNNIRIHKSQQDAHITEFILSDNCSTCLGRHHHPSSGAQNNCNYSIW
jgi:hypothetical protein